tara:strand:+ start:16373 stop:18193 length:1821 start_codon:yes stop_codon:yes gene_type:complete
MIYSKHNNNNNSNNNNKMLTRKRRRDLNLEKNTASTLENFKNTPIKLKKSKPLVVNKKSSSLSLEGNPYATAVKNPITITNVMNQVFNKDVRTIFYMLDTVHDIFERGHHRVILQLIYGDKNKPLNPKPDIMDAFCNLVFDFEGKFSKQMYRSISGKNTFRANSFKQWLIQYLEITSKHTLNIKDLKEAWKIQILILASRMSYVFLDIQIYNPLLPYLRGLTDRIITKKVASSYIAGYDILLATDALKSNDKLKTHQDKATLVMPSFARKVGKFDVSNNYVCNMAQIIDPSNNIKKGKAYRYAFPPLSDITPANHNQQWKSRIYKLHSTNTQITSMFTISIEVCDEDDGNSAIQEIKQHVRNNKKHDLLTTQLVLASEFFKYVRVFVKAKPINNTSNILHPYNNVSLHGVCIQLDNFKLNSEIQNIHKFEMRNKLSGLSVEDVIFYMKKDIRTLSLTPPVFQINKKPIKLTIKQKTELRKQIVNYYLDWKRMGDSFQITHLKDIGTANELNPIYHPYHFLSIDILAIVQCMMNNVHFVYEKSENAYMIGNVVHDKRFIKYQNNIKQTINQNQNKLKKMRNNHQKMENATNILMSLGNNTYLSNGNY